MSRRPLLLAAAIVLFATMTMAAADPQVRITRDSVGDKGSNSTGRTGGGSNLFVPKPLRNLAASTPAVQLPGPPPPPQASSPQNETLRPQETLQPQPNNGAGGSSPDPVSSFRPPPETVDDFTFNHPSQFVQRLAEHNISYQLDYNFKRLPREGSPLRIPWPASFWPTFNDSINDPWFKERPSDRGPAGKYAKAFGMDADVLEDVVSKTVGIESYLRNVTECAVQGDCEKGFKCGRRKRFNRAAGAYVQDQVGRCVPEWYGVCHAWSGASIVEHEPRCPVEINGVKFFTPDIEALEMMFYDKYNPDFVHIGTRCSRDTPYHLLKNNQSAIPRDKYGRIADQACRDINPGVFHIIMGNYMGIDRYSIVMDEDYTAEIWNYPITRYEVQRADPISRQDAGKLFNNADTYPFNDAAASLLHVMTSVSFLGEINPAPYPITYVPWNMTQQFLHPHYTNSRTYTYILELDAEGNIIGGQWTGNSMTSHVDFLWAPVAKNRKLIDEDPVLFEHRFVDPVTGVMKVDGIRYSIVHDLLQKSLESDCNLRDMRTWYS